MISRENVLKNVRTALGRAAGQPRAALASPSLQVTQSGPLRNTDLFVQAFEKLAGKSIRVRTTSEVIGAIAGLLDHQRVVASNASFLSDCGIIRLTNVESGFQDREQLRAACAQADIGITSADYALADTGTLVMLSSCQEARLISLLPPVHIAIFPSGRILTGLDELLTVLPNPASRSSSMVLITGPSRTADIEQILVRGVHGPGEIYAVIVEEGL